MTNNDLFPETLPPSIDLPDEDWRRYCAAEEQRKEAKRLQREAKALVQPIADKLKRAGKTCGVFSNGTVYLIKSVEREAFDANRLKAEHPEVYEAYTTTKQSSTVEVYAKGIFNDDKEDKSYEY